MFQKALTYEPYQLEYGHGQAAGGENPTSDQESYIQDTTATTAPMYEDSDAETDRMESDIETASSGPSSGASSGPYRSTG